MQYLKNNGHKLTRQSDKMRIKTALGIMLKIGRGTTKMKILKWDIICK